MSATPPAIEPHASHVVARKFVALALGEAVARAVAFTATIHAARILEAGHYGAVGVAAAIVLFLNRIVDAGFELGLGVRELARQPGLVTTGVPTIQAARSGLAVIAIAGASAVGAALLPPVEAAVLAMQSLTLIAVGLGSRWVHLAFGRARQAAVANITGQLVMAAGVVALVRDGDDVLMLPLASVLGELTTAGILLAGLRSLGVRRLFAWDRSLLAALVPRSSSMVASALLGIAIFSAGLMVLRILRDSEAAGFYTAAFAMVTFFLNVGAMYNLSLLPALTRLRSEPAQQRRLFMDALVYTMAWSVPLGAGGTVLAASIVDLTYGRDFSPAAVAFGLLIWAVPLNVLRDVALMTLLAEGHEARVARLTLVGAITAVGSALLLVAPLGLAGAAVATLAAEVVRCVHAAILAGGLGYTWPSAWRIGRVAAATALMLLALQFAPPMGIFVAIGVGAITYVLALAGTGGLGVANRRLVLRL